MSTDTKINGAALELGLMLSEIDEHIRKAATCEQESLERGWKEGSAYSLAGYHLPGRALLLAILSDGGEAMVAKRGLTTLTESAKSVQGLAKQAEAHGMPEAAEKLRALASSIEGPDNIKVADAIDVLLDARCIIQAA